MPILLEKRTIPYSPVEKLGGIADYNRTGQGTGHCLYNMTASTEEFGERQIIEGVPQIHKSVRQMLRRCL